MEEKANMPDGYVDKWLVDREVSTPFGIENSAETIGHYPYEDAKSSGYIRYVIRGKQMIILDCLVVEYKD
jgi:hypothetical protein